MVIQALKCKSKQIFFSGIRISMTFPWFFPGNGIPWFFHIREIFFTFSMISLISPWWWAPCQGQGHSQDQTWYIVLTFVAWRSIDRFPFRFMAILTFLAEIQQIPYLTLNFQGEGHVENWPKSNEIIYRSGPSIPPKMKEIRKVARKVSR